MCLGLAQVWVGKNPGFAKVMGKGIALGVGSSPKRREPRITAELPRPDRARRVRSEPVYVLAS